MVKIFVSYSRVDSDVMKKFAELLGYGCDVWYDQAPSGIIGGEDWWKRILGEIGQREHFAYLMSPEAVNSEYCQKELGRAIELGKNVIPVRIRVRTELPEKIQHLHAIEAYGDLLLDGISRVYGSILKNMEIKPILTEAHRQADLRLLQHYWGIIDIYALRWLLYKIESYDGTFDFEGYAKRISYDLLELARYPESNFHDKQLQVTYYEIANLMMQVETYDSNLHKEKEIEEKTNMLIDDLTNLLRTSYPEQSLLR
jgi:hypothetical protein